MGVVARDGGKPAGCGTQIGLDPLHFVQRQAVRYLPMAVVIPCWCGCRRWSRCRAGAALGDCRSLRGAVVLLDHDACRAARRLRERVADGWNLGGFSLQPSEFVKPALAVVCAWMFAAKRLGCDDGPKPYFVLPLRVGCSLVVASAGCRMSLGGLRRMVQPMVLDWPAHDLGRGGVRCWHRRTNGGVFHLSRTCEPDRSVHRSGRRR